MGWKGNVRTLNSAVNQAQRSAARRQRELAAQQKQAARLADTQRAAYDVAVFDNTIDVLTSIHRESASLMDWEAILREPVPEPPQPSHVHASAAEAALAGYEPRGLAKIGAEKKRERLTQAVSDGRNRDEQEYAAAKTLYEQSLVAREESQDIAKRVLAGEKSGYVDAFDKFNAFSDMATLGAKISFVFHTSGLVGALIAVHGEEVVPSQVKSQLASGKLSSKNMPKGRFYEIYQDYVCGAVLRVANDLCALLPVRAVLVTAYDDLLDSSTGKLSKQALLSALIPRATLEHMDLEKADASDAMKNFVHRVAFKKTSGFSPVEHLKVEDVPEELR